VTYLTLFVSLLVIVTVTYSYAVIKINGKSAQVKASVAKQNMQMLDDTIRSVAWTFGASGVVSMDDCGGTFQTVATDIPLLLNLTDEASFSEVLFDSSIGQVKYELENGISDIGTYIRGDERAAINLTAFTITQLHVTSGENSVHMVLNYRPFATATTTGQDNGRPINRVRVNILSLNASERLWLKERFSLKITSLNVTSHTNSYLFNTSISSLALKAELNGTETTVCLPIESSADGASVIVDVVTCIVRVEKVGA
jgi:hypothetical protein